MPGDASQVMYVWCDALTNYLSGIGYTTDRVKFDCYYPTYLHVIGKDISRFHAVIYMAMLMSADMELSENILVHGFVNVNGQKLSKSLGNAVAPADILADYPSDALRYFVAVGGGEVGSDIEYSAEGFKNLYNSGLVNGLGNIANRISVLFCKYYPEGVSTEGFTLDANIEETIHLAYTQYGDSMGAFDLRSAYSAVTALIDTANMYFDTEKPWTIKDDSEKLRGILLNLVELLYHTTILVAPFLPETALKMQEIFDSVITRIEDQKSMIDPVFRICKANDNIALKTISLLFEKK